MNNNIPQNTEEQEIDLRVLLDMITRHKRLILIITGVIFALVVLYILFTKPVYEAKGKLLYESSSSTADIFGLSALDGIGQSKKIDTQLEILKSYPIFDATLQNIGVQDKNEKGKIKKNLTITNVKGTDIFTITYEDTDPQKASQVVNAFMNAAIGNNIEAKKDKTHDSKTFVEEQLTKKETELAKAEEAIRKYKEKQYIVDISEESKALITKYAELDGEKMKAMLALQDVNAKSERLREILGIPLSPVNIKDPELDKLKNKLSRLEANKLSENNIDKKRNDEIEDLKKQITQKKLALIKQVKPEIPSQKNVYSRNAKDEFYQKNLQELMSVEVEKESILERLKEFDKLIAGYNSKLQKVPTQELELTRLLREREVNAKIYEILLTKGQEISISTAAIVGDLRIIEPSTIPDRPIKPKKAIILTIGLISGLLLGIIISFGYEYLKDIPGYDEVERLLGNPIVWNIPRTDKNEPLVAFTDPRASISEAFRSIRTHLKFINPDKPFNSLVVTSSVSGDGKSFVASNLAIVMAQLGKKVVLLDGDIRKPSVHSIFNVPMNRGLSAYLIGEITSVEDILHKTKIENLSIIPSGPIPPNASELLDSKRMDVLLAELRQQFDFVVIDTPPIIAVSDALILYGKSDGMIFVAAADETNRSAIKLAKYNIDKTNIKITGVVLNKVDTSHNKYSAYYNYGPQEK